MFGLANDEICRLRNGLERYDLISYGKTIVLCPCVSTNGGIEGSDNDEAYLMDCQVL